MRRMVGLKTPFRAPENSETLFLCRVSLNNRVDKFIYTAGSETQ